MLDSFEQESKKNLVSWENFLAVIAGNSSPDVLDLISRVEHSDSFRIEQANDQRALYGRFALNRKKSLQTEKGRSFLQKTLLRLAPINEHSTVSMLRVFGALDAHGRQQTRYRLSGFLHGCYRISTRKKHRVSITLPAAYWRGHPHAVQNYEQHYGSITALRT